MGKLDTPIKLSHMTSHSLGTVEDFDQAGITCGKSLLSLVKLATPVDVYPVRRDLVSGW